MDREKDKGRYSFSKMLKSGNPIGSRWLGLDEYL
jgi:hypothetical protein